MEYIWLITFLLMMTAQKLSEESERWRKLADFLSTVGLGEDMLVRSLGF
jgi:hypothetical protein